MSLIETYTATTVHEQLSLMAWERLPKDATHEAHLTQMAVILSTQELYEELWKRIRTAPQRPTIVCLCGSTRFWQEYLQFNASETMQGRIVLSVGFYVHDPDEPVSVVAHRNVTAEEKQKLDELHLRKIDLADEILILNRGGYIGDSTRSELAYARKMRKVVRSIEPLKAEDLEPV